jgi:hypothetical protein
VDVEDDGSWEERAEAAEREAEAEGGDVARGVDEVGEARLGGHRRRVEVVAEAKRERVTAHRGRELEAHAGTKVSWKRIASRAAGRGTDGWRSPGTPAGMVRSSATSSEAVGFS